MADGKILGMSKPMAYVTLAGGAVVAFLVFRHYQNASAANAAASAANPANTAPPDIDPATGFPYGSPEDEAALAQQNGYGVSGVGAGFGNVTEPFVPVSPV